MFCFVLSLMVLAGDRILEMGTLDYQKDPLPFLLDGAHYMVVVEDGIVLGNQDQSRLLLIGRDGRVEQVIAEEGNGPGEIKGSLQGVAGDGQHLYAMIPGKLLHFVGGEYKDEVFIKPSAMLRPIFTMRPCAWGSQIVVPQVPDERRFLAEWIDFSSGVRRSFAPMPTWPKELLKEKFSDFPNFFSTLWAKNENHWYALFPYYPKILVYDEALNHIDTLDIESPVVAAYLATLKPSELKKNANGNITGYRQFPALFTDFFADKNSLYLLCRGVLLRWDLASGGIAEHLYMACTHPSMGDRAGENLAPSVFCLAKDGTAFFSNVNYPHMDFPHEIFIYNFR
jgi:hypothetical protein